MKGLLGFGLASKITSPAPTQGAHQVQDTIISLVLAVIPQDRLPSFYR